MTLALSLFAAGSLTILLPCILPLIPIVLGVSVAGRSKWRPLLTVVGMVVSFVGFTFLLLIVLRQFVEVADYMRIGTYYLLLLFGLGFLTHQKKIQYPGALAGSLFFLQKGYPSVAVAAVAGSLALYFGGRIATRIQQIGSGAQSRARAEFGESSPLTAFIIGLTMGLVWVPCAGPALGFAFTLVREQPGFEALLYLTAYGLGSAFPLLLIGYGGQAAVHSVRTLSKHSGRIKQASGALLILTALSFQFHWFTKIETWFVLNTNYGTLGTRLEEQFFSETLRKKQDNMRVPVLSEVPTSPSSLPVSFSLPGEQGNEKVETSSASISDMVLPKLPTFTRAPEFEDLGPWHNADPFTLESLKGKVVLVDFWTYSCINCIRTLPYMQGYWDKFKDTPFVLLGVHTPEFVFEKSESNVAEAIQRHSLTYPIAQDNNYKTWSAFANRYWPAKYLIDADGYIRYTHFGEGDYQETDLAIQSLLNEIGVEPMGGEVEKETVFRGPRKTPETYLGTRNWRFFGNSTGVPDEKIHTYTLPGSFEDDHFYMGGDWQLIEEERQALRSNEGVIAMRFTASEINLVMSMEAGAPPAAVAVFVDGAKVTEFTIDYNDLFSLWKGEYGTHDIEIRVTGPGAEGYAFTFG